MIDDKKIEEAAINKCGFISYETYEHVQAIIRYKRIK